LEEEENKNKNIFVLIEVWCLTSVGMTEGIIVSMSDGKPEKIKRAGRAEWGQKERRTSVKFFDP
jgi:hypothetical protein